MRRTPHTPMRRLVPALALLASLAGPPALAQYRPPPMSESQRLVKDGETAQVSASAASASGDKKEADEKYRKALALFEQALAAEPGSVAAAAGVGSAANALQDWARTVDRVKPVQAANASELSLAYPLGVALFKLRRFPEAVPLLEQVAGADQAEHLIVHYYLASYYLFAQQGDAAVTRLQKYLTLRPAKLAGNDFQVHELLGRAHVLRRDGVAARASFTQAQAGRPESPTVQQGLASVLELEGKLGEARTLLEGVTTRFPQVAEPKEKLARLYLASGEVPRAEAQAVAMVKLGASPSAYLLLGDVRLAQKQAPAAEEAYRKVLELQPGLVLGQMAVGKALQAQGRHEEAIQFLEAAVRSGASSVELWASLGSVNRRAGRFQRAVEVHRRVVEMVPRQALGWMLLGADHFATGQWDQAIEDYGNALQVEPTHAGAKQWLARALAHRARDRGGA
ncbi:tetratricopeptide repeat protein, partial [Myxococcus sp. CA039A]